MIRPLRDLLVLRPKAKPGMVGLIIIPDSGKQRDKTGGFCEVMAAGPLATETPVGTVVHVTAYGDKFAGEEVNCGGETLLMIRARDVNGVLD